MMRPYIFDHPLITDKITRLRDRTTGTTEFRQLVEQITALMLFEASRNLPVEIRTVETPLATIPCPVLAGDPPVLIPILRAGLAMVDPLLRMFPNSPVGHVGLVRDHNTLQPVRYLVKLPADLSDRPVWVLDPMLATGGSVSAALSLIKEQGANNITLISLIAAPEGVARLERDHPGIRIYIAALDDRLNDKGYILPGLGDAGDRLYGTE